MGQSASKEKFRESVQALIHVDVSADDAEFWDELWKIPASAEEVFELLSSHNVRTLRDTHFDNLATLFTQAVAQLCQIVETPYNIYFDQALNCVRVLTRILPFILEKGDLGDADENVEQLCWGTEGMTTSGNGYDKDTGTIGTSTTGGHSKFNNSKTTNDPTMDDQEPLALLVVHAAMHMLFLPQFTCDFYEESINGKPSSTSTASGKKKTLDKTTITAEMKRDDLEMKMEAGLQERQVEWGVTLEATPASIVWAPGVGVTITDILGSEHSHSMTRKYDKNRIEVLRLLLTACCDPLYSPADEYNPLASRWLAVATAADAPNNICLFYSLLNTILGFDPKTIPVATGFSEGNHMKLLELAVQVLCVLLDCGLPGQPDLVYDQNHTACVEYEVASKNGFNIFRTLLARVDTGRELTFIYSGFTRLLRNVYEAESTYMGGAKLGCYQELLVLFWKFLEENPYFITHILTQCDINDILVPICFLMYRSRRDPAHIGLVHICTFVLLKLSGERSFGVSLNRPFTKKLPTDLPLFHGCHTDLLVITLHKLVVNGAYKLVPLYSCFLTIISNISPYWKSMSLVAAVKMVNCKFHLSTKPFL
jgi:High-temperature-induced dauer-formation protein